MSNPVLGWIGSRPLWAKIAAPLVAVAVVVGIVVGTGSSSGPKRAASPGLDTTTTAEPQPVASVPPATPRPTTSRPQPRRSTTTRKPRATTTRPSRPTAPPAPAPPATSAQPEQVSPPPPPPRLPPPPPPSRGRWKPSSHAHITWNWQLQGAVPTNTSAEVFDIDGFDNSAATVAALHAHGTKVICYVDVGTSENFRSDFGAFPASVQGSTNGWPGEKWLDIRKLSVLEPIMTARMRMCKQKGFDAVEPDNIDGYTNDTGFPLTGADQLRYNTWVANTAHSLGLSVGLKNDVDQTAQLEPHFDWALDEQCNQYTECGTENVFVRNNKAVFNAEYEGGTSFCGSDAAAHINGVLFSLDLDGSTFQPCGGTW